jgi:hypothetical protein
VAAFDEIERILAEKARVEGSRAGSRSPGRNLVLPCRRVHDIPATEPVGWLCEGILAAGEVTLLVSRPKVGKSTLARFLAACVLEGRPFLCRETRRGPVLLAAPDDAAWWMRECFLRLGVLNHPGLYAVDLPLRARALTPESLFATAAEIGAKLVVVDTLQRCFPTPDMNDYSQTVDLMGRIQDGARQAECAALVLHHTNKRAVEYDDHSIGVMGSQGLFGTAAILATLSRDERWIWLQTEGRYGRNLPKTLLEFDEDTMRFRAAGTQCEIRETERRQRALEVVRSNPGIARQELAAKIGGDASLTKRVLDALVADGSVVREGSGVKGSPFTYRAASDHA